MSIRTLIVDDEVLSRDGIRGRLSRERDFEIIGEGTDGPKAITRIEELAPDLVLLDLEMPDADGLEVLRRVKGGAERLPLVVFVTACEQYAVKAFDANAIDYLLKPVAESRFQEMLRRVRSELSRQQLLREAQRGGLEGGERGIAAGHERSTRLIVKHRDRFVILNTSQVDWIASADNYLELHAQSGRFFMRATMQELDEALDPNVFARIHRSTIVRIEAVAEILPSEHGDFTVGLQDGTRLRLSRKYRHRLFSSAFPQLVHRSP